MTEESVLESGMTASETQNSLKIKKLEEEIEDLRQDRELRKLFSKRIFWFVVCYIFSVVFNYAECSDTVVVTLLSTTTANVVALFAFVARYLYNIRK